MALLRLSPAIKTPVSVSSGSHDKNSTIDRPLDWPLIWFDWPLADPDDPLTDQGPRSSASPATQSSPPRTATGYSYTTPPPPRSTPSPHVWPYPTRYGAPEVLLDFAPWVDWSTCQSPSPCFTPPSPWFYFWNWFCTTARPSLIAVMLMLMFSLRLYCKLEFGV